MQHLITEHVNVIYSAACAVFRCIRLLSVYFSSYFTIGKKLYVKDILQESGDKVKCLQSQSMWWVYRNFEIGMLFVYT